MVGGMEVVLCSAVRITMAIHRSIPVLDTYYATA
jgi:hypothetical protein